VTGTEPDGPGTSDAPPGVPTAGTGSADRAGGARPVDRPDRARWTVVVPAKAPARAKTRLAPHIGDEFRMALARAFAADTITAALAAESVAHVIVVGDDPTLANGAEFLDERLPDPSGSVTSAAAGVPGLTASIARGIAFARASGAGDIGVLLGDLPCVRPDDLDAALARAAEHPLAFVADADGTGTTLATALAGVRFEPHFGADSASEHERAGFVPLEASARLRRDVDTLDALEDAIAIGTGARTAHAVATLADRGPLPPAE
jgi:2-phospho-L-lactate guanylyltransferase